VPNSITCSCGRVLRFKDEMAGKKAKCPACGAIMVLPANTPATPEDEASSLLISDSPGIATSKRSVPEPDLSDALDRPLYRPSDKEIRKELRKPSYLREREAAPPITFERGWFGSTNAGMIGGILMMVIAVVWFVVGWMGGVIFFYPPILLVIGICAFMKGLFNRS